MAAKSVWVRGWTSSSGAGSVCGSCASAAGCGVGREEGASVFSGTGTGSAISLSPLKDTAAMTARPRMNRAINSFFIGFPLFLFISFV